MYERGFLATPDDFIHAPPPLGCVMAFNGKGYGSAYALDSSPYGNHGTMISTTWGKANGGIWVHTFATAGNRIDCGTASVLNLTGDFTLLAWVYAVALNADNRVFHKGMYEVGGYALLSTNTGQLVLQVHQAGGHREILTGAGVISTGRYYFIGAVRSGTSGGIYVNGVDVTDGGDLNTNPVTVANPLLIGIYGDLASARWTGDMGLCRVYPHALLARDILQLYQNERHMVGV